MQCDRTLFIQSLFGFLSGMEYVWLKAILQRPENTPVDSDIDLLVKKEEVSGIQFYIAKHPSVIRFETIKKYEVICLHLRFQDGSQLKLDLITALVRKQFTYLPNEYIFANRVWNNGVATYGTEVLLEHVLLFNFLNHAGLPAKYVHYFEAFSSAEKEGLLAFINVKYGCHFQSFRQMAHFSITTKGSFLKHLKHSDGNGFGARLNRSVGYICHLFSNKKPNTPSIITFSGVDGAGKSTLLNDLKTVLTEKLGQQVITLRHRPSLLPILSTYKHGKQTAEAKAAASLPRQGKNSSTLSSLFRFGYYYSDYLLGQMYIWLRYVLLGYTVIYDRYYFDFIVDAKRSNIILGESLPKKLYRFIFKPDLNIFLYADPETIRQRKQELPKADIVQMTEQYLKLFEELKNEKRSRYVCIENKDRSVSLDKILKEYFSVKNLENVQLNNTEKILCQPTAVVNPDNSSILEVC